MEGYFLHICVEYTEHVVSTTCSFLIEKKIMGQRLLLANSALLSTFVVEKFRVFHLGSLVCDSTS